jgi:hypothetical protein
VNPRRAASALSQSKAATSVSNIRTSLCVLVQSPSSATIKYDATLFSPLNSCAELRTVFG